jgi:hypothetical protein
LILCSFIVADLLAVRHCSRTFQFTFLEKGAREYYIYTNAPQRFIFAQRRAPEPIEKCKLRRAAPRTDKSRGGDAFFQLE